jgi:CRISPR-associated protein Cas1
VRRKRERLLVQQSTDEGRETLAAHPACDLDAVALVGRGTHCTTPALRFCLQRDLTVLLLSSHGKIQGYLAEPDPGRVDVRRAQYAATRRAERRVPYARAWVGTKLHNMQRRLYRRACRTSGCPALETALQTFDPLERRHMRADDLDTLRGLEGAAARAYFKACLLPTSIGTPCPWSRILQRKRFNENSR